MQLSSSLWSEQSRKPSHSSPSSTQASPSEQRVPLAQNRGPRVAEQPRGGGNRESKMVFLLLHCLQLIYYTGKSVWLLNYLFFFSSTEKDNVLMLMKNKQTIWIHPASLCQHFSLHPPRWDSRQWASSEPSSQWSCPSQRCQSGMQRGVLRHRNWPRLQRPGAGEAWVGTGAWVTLPLTAVRQRQSTEVCFNQLIGLWVCIQLN